MFGLPEGNWSTPVKFNIEPENQPPGKGDSFLKPSFSGSMLNFWGFICFFFPRLQTKHAFRLRSARPFIGEAERHDDRHCHGARAGDYVAEMGQTELSWECGLYNLVKLFRDPKHEFFTPKWWLFVRDISGYFRETLGWWNSITLPDACYTLLQYRLEVCICDYQRSFLGSLVVVFLLITSSIPWKMNQKVEVWQMIIRFNWVFFFWFQSWNISGV